jgi:hypothetical protein
MRKLDSFKVSIIAATTATGPTAARENNWHVREVTATVSSVPHNMILFNDFKML